MLVTGLFYAGDWFVLRERYYWLVIDKPNELSQLVLEKKTSSTDH
jgi:hypothetical protein